MHLEAQVTFTEIVSYKIIHKKNESQTGKLRERISLSYFVLFDVVLSDDSNEK